MIAWSAAAVAAFYSLWSVALALLFFTRLRVQDDRLSANIALVLPATGTLPGLEELLNALLAQSLFPRRLIIAVESRDDPAYARITDLSHRYARLNIEIVIAGLSPLRSQPTSSATAR